MANVGSTLVQFPRRRADGPSLFAEYGMAAVGAGLLALPFLDAVDIGSGLAWPVAVDGGVAVILALTARFRLLAWQIWCQLGLGFAMFALVFVWPHSVGRHEWLAVLAAMAIIVLAALQLDCLAQEIGRAKHRGWRAPSPIVCRGPRLVHSRSARPSTARVMISHPEPADAA
jgi:hypothetical protein